MMHIKSNHHPSFILTISGMLLIAACSDDADPSNLASDETSTTAESGDGDGDSGDGDGDSGDGDGDSGDGDGDSGDSGDGNADSGDGDGDTGDGDGDGDGDSGDPGGDGPCENTCGNLNCGACPSGPESVDLGDYLIDATEITNAQYAQFLAVDFDEAYLAELMPPTCGWKTDFTPANWPAHPVPNLPVANVDWCDATAYCAWAGKRLCGTIGGGPAELPDVQNANVNEWYRACTMGGVSNYPYGLNYEPGHCNNQDAGFGQVLEVGSLVDCEGGYAGIFDLSGNVWEWTNACDDGANLAPSDQACRRRGGSYFSNDADSLCLVNSLRARNFRNINQGFRCCDSP